MHSCGKCCGNCGSCSNAIELTAGEIALLQKLGQIPFLPVARTAEDATPIYLEEGDDSKEEYSLILQCLEKRRLITIDFDAPIKGYSSLTYPICGSIALTQLGQQVLELMEIQGLS